MVTDNQLRVGKVKMSTIKVNLEGEGIGGWGKGKQEGVRGEGMGVG